MVNSIFSHHGSDENEYQQEFNFRGDLKSLNHNFFLNVTDIPWLMLFLLLFIFVIANTFILIRIVIDASSDKHITNKEIRTENLEDIAQSRVI